MDLKKLNRREYYGAYILVFIVLCVLIGIMMNPGSNKASKASDFAKPLFEHKAPADTVVLNRSEDGGKTDGKSYYFACLVVQSKLSKEDLESFYNDISYPPMAEGQEVSLRVFPVEGDSVDVVKSAEDYKEGAGDLWYIYLYSSEK